MDRHELLEWYESTGDERYFQEARPLYEEAVAAVSDAQLLLEYGYLLECQGRNAIRLAIAQYERAIELDPLADAPRYQLINARAAVLDTDEEIARYEAHVLASPRDVRGCRLLASAYLAAHEFAKARELLAAALELEPQDPALIAARGDARARLGDPDGALADWRRALELDSENIGPLYSSAFLLDREGRLEEAVNAWQAILDWNQTRGYTLQSRWPSEELERLRGKLADG
jgi:tetratricopeptide (TPR) repeat protein